MSSLRVRLFALQEAKSPSTADAGQSDVDSSSLDPLVTYLAPNGTAVSNGSLQTGTDDDDETLNSGETNRTTNSSRRGLSKLKEQIAQRARSVTSKAPSLTSIFTSGTSASANIEHVCYLTEICIDRGKDLSVKDVSGTSDPYVRVFYGNEEKYTTNTVSKSLNPIWNEKFTFFTHDLNIPISFHVYDHDLIGRDEPMGSARLDLFKIPIDRSYSATLDLDHEKRNDGRCGMLKITISLAPKTAEFRDEVRTESRRALHRYLL